ncbi:hypothetical protein BT63DRAFT_428385 [Microthyrium microscopicum]|uniref:DUF1279 domain-containing protein n=1 Tax=Microthyrium microscopicum TaxID=703497 RepID=A0A6A6TZC4_9PEZI|nr:hypothetical protein BT63DRAFT_428385 [Microthyrium microscopicum]
MALPRIGLTLRLPINPSVNKLSALPKRTFCNSPHQSIRIPGSSSRQPASSLRHAPTPARWQVTTLFRSQAAKNARWKTTWKTPQAPRPNPDPTPNLGSPASLSLSQRLKKLSREYGWTAVGVYFALSVLDFPFCFLAVRMLGPERVGQWEHAAVEWVRETVEIPFPGLMKPRAEPAVPGDRPEAVLAETADKTAMASGDSSASLWTLLVLSYAVHKSLIFFRVPLTAAVLPKVVKTLRQWGWDVGKRSSKA